MARTLKIQLTSPSDDLIHKFRNFGEAVYSALRDDCEISIKEIDVSTSQFYVRGIHKRELRITAAKVRQIAEKHYKAEIVNVTEIVEPHDA
jgi:hypothetical protein